MSEPLPKLDAVTELPDLSLDAAREEWTDLAQRVLDARDAYYGRDAELVDDATYDGWMHRLEALERRYPELQGQDSPTQSVGAAEATDLVTIEHAERMLSLDNVFSPDELRDWAVKTQASAARPVQWLSELKIDGLAINLRYENGVFDLGGDPRRRSCRRDRDRQRAAGGGNPSRAVG